MAVTIADVARVLGREVPAADSFTAEQWTMWISDARMLIEARLGDIEALNQDRLDYVVREAVAAHVRRPDDATMVDVAVDDGRESRRYSSAAGRVKILDEWWNLLDPGQGQAKAFDIDTTPNRGAMHDAMCTLLLGGTVCSCGAVLSGFMPVYYDGRGY